MKTLDIEQADTLLARYAADPEQEAVIVTVKGRPLVVVLPVQGADVETVSLSLNPKFNAIMQRSAERHAKEGGISLEEIRRRYGIPPAANRRATDPKGKPRAKRPRRKVAK